MAYPVGQDGVTAALQTHTAIITGLAHGTTGYTQPVGEIGSLGAFQAGAVRVAGLAVQ